MKAKHLMIGVVIGSVIITLALIIILTSVYPYNTIRVTETPKVMIHNKTDVVMLVDVAWVGYLWIIPVMPAQGNMFLYPTKEPVPLRFYLMGVLPLRVRAVEIECVAMPAILTIPLEDMRDMETQIHETEKGKILIEIKEPSY